MDGFGDALDAMLERVTAIGAEVGDRFPLYAEPAGGWVSTRRGSWTGGFWAGLWSLRAACRPSAADRAAATEWSRRLAPRAADDTVTRGMTFWYGAGLPHLLSPAPAGPETAEIALAGARALAEAFSERWGLIPLGAALGGAPDARAGIDALAGTVGLLAWAGDRADPQLRQIALRHADRHVELLVAPDGRVHREVPLEPGAADPAEQPAEHPDQVWSRGQAWGMLGCAVAARDLGASFVPAAEATARWWRERGVDVPPAVWGRPGAPPDTSAAAIAAAAFHTLGGLDLPDAAAYRDAARAIAGTLVREHLDGRGALRDGCYDADGGVATTHELIWGSYFLTGLLAVLDGRLPREPW